MKKHFARRLLTHLLFFELKQANRKINGSHEQKFFAFLYHSQNMNSLFLQPVLINGRDSPLAQLVRASDC